MSELLKSVPNTEADSQLFTFNNQKFIFKPKTYFAYNLALSVKTF